MVTAEQLGYKHGEASVGEGSYIALRPQFDSILSPAQILRKRLEELDALPKDKRWKKNDIGPWNSHFFGTSMGVAGTVLDLVLGPNSPALAASTPDTPDSGIPMIAIPPTAKQYNREAYARHINRPLLESEVPINPFWLEAAEGDSELLGQLAQLTFRALRDVYHDDEGMGFHFPTDDEMTEGALVLDSTYGSANAGGDRYLGYGGARLVGVRRGAALVEAGKAVLPYTSTDVEAAREQIENLKKKVSPEELTSLEALLKKL